MPFGPNAPARRLSLVLMTVLAAGGAAARAHAQAWTVINLHPSWAVNSELRGIDGATQVGVANNAVLAMKWTGASTAATVLNPVRENAALATSAAGGRQGGSVSLDFGVATHAALWSGSSGTFVDLHPADPAVLHSNLLGMSAAAQVGSYYIPDGGQFSSGRACMWSGTAESFVDLQPLAFQTGEARGAFGDQQVGATFDGLLGAACMWTGTADSFVDLTPADSIASVAQCTDGTHQYGIAGIVSETLMGFLPVRWSGTPESVESMGVPEGLYGEILATHGGYQVGDTFDSNSENFRAMIWTAQNVFEDLHQYLPASFSQSQAMGVWRHEASGTTYVVGYGVNSVTGKNEAMMWVRSEGVNLITSPSAPEECAHVAGETMTYTVRVLNAGPVTSGAVTLTVDLPPAATAAFVSATPAPTSVTGTQAVFTLSPLAGLGGAADITINLMAVGAGTTATITASASASGEVDPTNNTASASARVVPAATTAFSATGAFTTNTALANSTIPGGAGRFRSFGRPIASPSGEWWVVRALTDLPASRDMVVVRTSPAGTSAIIGQEGVTTTSRGTVTELFVGAEINDNGRVAMGGTDSSASATRNFVVVTDGAGLTDVARSGQAVPAMPGVNYSGLGGGVNLFSDGQVGFYTTSSPAGSNAYLSANGAAVLARANVTQPVGASAPLATLLSNAAGTGALAFDATGAHSIYQADLATGDTANDQVIVADGTVVMQENTTVLPGMSSPVDGNTKPFSMGADGTWLVRGANGITTETWVARGVGSSILDITRGGDPIVPGSSEHWAPVFTSGVVRTTFFAAVADSSGKALIGGYTDSADTFTDSVLVYDGRVVARENDPIDLDGNGLFDDEAYIRSFDADSVAFLQGAVLVSVTYRDAASALCRVSNANRGQAIIRVALPTSCAADFNGDDFLDFFDYDDYVNCFETAVCPPGRTADFNGDDFVDFFDYDDFVNAFETGC